MREIRLIRNEQEMEGLNDRVLQFEESGGIRIVSYNDYAKETVFRDPEGKEQVDVMELSVDEKVELDAMYDIVSEYEEMETDEAPILEEEKEIDDACSRDEIDDNDRDEMEM
ncbi:MAG TPA: hypothetical protein VFE53_26970 [Mucilaginibacter sp.]|nr:hypothetical protein [Mucilaginibacter sp.]